MNYFNFIHIKIFDGILYTFCSFLVYSLLIKSKNSGKKMVYSKKSRFKPRFKKLANSKIVIHNKCKILQFQKQKWDKQKIQYLRLNTSRKRNCYYKFYDPRAYNVPRFMNKFTNTYKQNLRSRRRFKLFMVICQNITL